MTTPCETITMQAGMLFTCEQVNGYVKIQTPFLYPDGDIIDVFYKEDDDGALLTDLGETTRWLRMQTISQRKSPRQRQIISDICLNHNVQFHHGMITTHISRTQDITGAVFRLAQGMMRVSDLWFTFRNKAGESIVDEVEDLLQERNIVFERNPQVAGRSTTNWRPDFKIGHKERSSLVRVLSTGSRAASRDLVARTSAMWYDLSYLTARQEITRFISLFDDSVDVWNEEDFRLVENVSEIAYWSRSDEFLQKIA